MSKKSATGQLCNYLSKSISLAACLSLTKGDKTEIPTATRVHNLLRFERVSLLQAMGVANREARSGKKVPTADGAPAGKATLMHKMAGPWIVEHDPEAYAMEQYADAAECVRTGQENEWKNTNYPSGVKYVPWTIDSLVEAMDKGEPTFLDADWSS